MSSLRLLSAGILVVAFGGCSSSAKTAPKPMQPPTTIATLEAPRILSATPPGPPLTPALPQKPNKAAPVSVAVESTKSLAVVPADDGALLLSGDGAWILGPEGITDESALRRVVQQTRPVGPHMGHFQITGVDGPTSKLRIFGTATDGTFSNASEYRDFVKRGATWRAIATERKAPFRVSYRDEVTLSNGAELKGGPNYGEIADCPEKGHRHYRFNIAKAPDGTVFAVGTPCEPHRDINHPRPIVIERWKRNAIVPEVTPIPAVGGYHWEEKKEFLIQAVAEDAAWIEVQMPGGAITHVSRFDGQGWTDVTPKDGQRRIHLVEHQRSAVAIGHDAIYVLRANSVVWTPIAGLAASDVTFFYTNPIDLVMAGTKDKLFVLEPGGATWEERIMPVGLEGMPVDGSSFKWIATFSNGDLLLQARTGKRDAVLLSGAHTPVRIP